MIAPALNLDFTTATLDSRITFARAAATATRINSSGYVETVAADTARFDYDPVALTCTGLLIEETRANVMTYSEDFRNTASAGSTRPWAWSNVTVTADAITSPANNNTADALFETSANSTHSLNAASAISGTVAGTNYIQSTFVKPNGRTRIILLDNAGNSSTSHILTGLGSSSVSAGAVTFHATQYIGNGWYRCIRGGATNASGVASPSLRLVNDSGSQSYTGDTAKGVYLWGAQLELGDFPTSYIPNLATGTTTRNADVATITGTNFSDWWQAGSGGVTVIARPSTVVGTRPWLQFDDNTVDNLIALRGNTTNPELYIKATTDQAQIDAGTIAANTTYSLTGWWQTNDCKARLNSGAAVVDTSATIPTVTQARLGSDGTNYLNGHLASIAYYDVFSSRIYTRRKNKVVSSLL